ncbi:MAG: matrixin family metalloprotease [Gammaproteobacteria bacterium]
MKFNIPVIFTAAILWVVAPTAQAMVATPAGVEPDSHFTISTADGAPIIGSDFVLGPTIPGKWGPPAFGTGATVSWSLMPTGTSCAAEGGGCAISALNAFMPVGFQSQIQNAFNAWSAVADITFVQIPDDGAAFNAPTASGNIRVGGHALDGPSGTLAHGFFPLNNGLTAAGDIHFDTAELWTIGFPGPGFDIFQVMAHEIGHAIGLDHTAVPNSLMNPFYTEAFSGPQTDDIAGAQFIYGARATAVPEPATLTLMGLGLFGMAWRRGRKGKLSQIQS